MCYADDEVTIMQTYGDRIREARKAKHMTQEELGELIGVTGVTIMRYEKGQREPRMDQLQKIGDVLGINWTYLVGKSLGGETLEEAASIYDESQKDLALEAGFALMLESIYGKPREVTIEGKWFDDSITVYGEGDNAFVLSDEAEYALLEAIPALVKSLVSSLGTPAAKAEEEMRAFLYSKEAKQLNDEAVARDKAIIPAMKQKKGKKSTQEE